MSFHCDITVCISKSSSLKNLIKDKYFKGFNAYLLNGIALLLTPIRFTPGKPLGLPRTYFGLHQKKMHSL